MVVTKLNLISLESIFLKNEQHDNIKTLLLSNDVTEFAYCYRTQPRKYGPGFMYNTLLAYERLKKYHDETQLNRRLKEESFLHSEQSTTNSNLNLREEIYHIQLINCLKSLRFAYESMTKTYFQLMNFMTNLGTVGQNLGSFQLDVKLPKAYEKEIMANKYLLENGFSFHEAMAQMKTHLVQETIAGKMTEYMNDLLAFLTLGISNEDDGISSILKN